jgi:hypothetical protein
VERRLTSIGIVLCGLVIAASVVLGCIRLVAGPRTVHHDVMTCPPSRVGETCVHDRHTGSVVGRSWLIVAGTLSVCAGAIGMSLLDHRKALSAG